MEKCTKIQETSSLAISIAEKPKDPDVTSSKMDPSTKEISRRTRPTLTKGTTTPIIWSTEEVLTITRSTERARKQAESTSSKDSTSTEKEKEAASSGTPCPTMMSSSTSTPEISMTMRSSQEKVTLNLIQPFSSKSKAPMKATSYQARNTEKEPTTTIAKSNTSENTQEESKKETGPSITTTTLSPTADSSKTDSPTEKASSSILKENKSIPCGKTVSTTNSCKRNDRATDR